MSRAETTRIAAPRSTSVGAEQRLVRISQILNIPVTTFYGRPEVSFENQTVLARDNALDLLTDSTLLNTTAAQKLVAAFMLIDNSSLRERVLAMVTIMAKACSKEANEPLTFGNGQP